MSAGAKHRLALLQKWESQLSPAQLEVWKAVTELLPRGHPHVGTDYGLEVFLMGMVLHDKALTEIAPHIPKPERRMVDRQSLAANDRSAA